MSESRKIRKRKEMTEWIVSLLIVAVAVVVIRTFVFCTVAVKGVSMEPNFYHGNIVAVNRLEYIISQPEKNDIVVCDFEDSKENQKLIKRVIGVPGDLIDFEWNDEGYYDLVVNMEVVEEDYIEEKMYHLGDMSFPYMVKEDEYFVMGDNRNDSLDSRYNRIGAIEKDEMIGKVFFSLKPFRNID